MATRFTLFILVLAGLAAALVYSQRRTGPYKVSGVVEADEIRLGSRVGGRVASIAVAEGRHVKAGDVLVTLEPFDLLERRAEAEARAGQLASQLEKLETGPRKQEIDASKARLSAAEAQVLLAAQTFERTQRLVKQDNASAEQLDKATNDVKASQANAEALRQELALLTEGTRKEDIAAARASLAAAKASLAIIDRQIEELTVKTPVDGVVEALDLQPGDLVAANAPVLSIMDARSLWIRTYVPEARLQIEVGRKVRVTLDAFPDQAFTGTVSFVARQGEFTPGNVQTPEERSKQVFRVKISLEGASDRLRPGMAADVWLGD